MYKDLFSLEEDVHYLNCAYMSPLPKVVAAAAKEGIEKQNQPYRIQVDEFFEPAQRIRQKFSKLINNPDPDRIALIPSVSYGMANVANNISLERGDELVFIEQAFPSDNFAFDHLAKKAGAELKFITAPDSFTDRAIKWNAAILEAISNKTKIVCIPHVHWSDGTIFDLASISERCQFFGVKLVIDGTQSVGALSFDLEEIPVDAVICAGYKWLLSPYSTGCAYYGPAFDDGMPIENSWFNRVKSDDFSRLSDYQFAYRPKAFRYNVGEFGNFTLLPMMEAALDLINRWPHDLIQDHCQEISQSFKLAVQELGYQIDSNGMAKHLFGICHPQGQIPSKLKTRLAEQKIYVSYRGNAIRIAPHLYNDHKDFQVLWSSLKNFS